ncbi:hypothetical protein ACQBAR_07200 [Propionibacteriaceae bacterium Y1685]
MRSGVGKLFLYMGIALMIVGGVAGVVGIIMALVTGDLSWLAFLILAAVFGGAGLVMHLVGRRSRVVLEQEGLRWTSPLGREQYVAWREVHQVVVPESPWQGRTAILWLHDGRRQPVGAVQMSSGNGGSWADAGYLAAGAEMVAAHQRWLANLR